MGSGERLSCQIVGFAHVSLQTLIIDPGQFKVLNDLLKSDVALKGKGRVETLSMAAGAAEDV